MTTKIKVTQREKRVSKKIQERRKWEKFGKLKGQPPGVEENVSFVSKDVVVIENPEEEAANAKAEEENIMKRLREVALQREMNKRLADKGLTPDMDDQPRGGLRTGTALSRAVESGGAEAAAASSGKYVPLHRREGAERSRYQDRDGEQNTLRVTNVSEDTTERDLQELFRPFGQLARIYLAKDRETHVSRGFAYVSYLRRDDAERAMEKLNGFGYDHLILKVEWAKPSTKEDIGSQNVLSKGFTSGYGKALPQGLGK